MVSFPQASPPEPCAHLSPPFETDTGIIIQMQKSYCTDQEVDLQ